MWSEEVGVAHPPSYPLSETLTLPSRWSWPGSLLPHSRYVWSLFPHRSPTPLNTSLLRFRSACFFRFLFFLTTSSTCLKGTTAFSQKFVSSSLCCSEPPEQPVWQPGKSTLMKDWCVWENRENFMNGDMCVCVCFACSNSGSVCVTMGEAVVLWFPLFMSLDSRAESQRAHLWQKFLWILVKLAKVCWLELYFWVKS